MNRLFRRAAGVIALGLVSLFANAQTPAPVAPDIPDLGSVTGSAYANKYFGLSLTVPAGWQVQDSGFKKLISDKGKELVTSDDPNKKRELDRAVDKTLNLLTITQYPPGTPGVFNSTFICGTEKLPAGVKMDADYMAALKNTLKYSQVPITIERDLYTEQIGGATFSVIDFSSTFSGVVVKQKYYAHNIKGYALFFILVYPTDEQLKTQTAILRSVVLK